MGQSMEMGTIHAGDFLVSHYFIPWLLFLFMSHLHRFECVDCLLLASIMLLEFMRCAMLAFDLPYLQI